MLRLSSFWNILRTFKGGAYLAISIKMTSTQRRQYSIRRHMQGVRYTKDAEGMSFRQQGKGPLELTGERALENGCNA